MPLCMRRTAGTSQFSLSSVDPGNLELSLSDSAGSVSDRRGSTAEWWHEQEQSCLPKARHKPSGKAGLPGSL